MPENVKVIRVVLDDCVTGNDRMWTMVVGGERNDGSASEKCMGRTAYK